MKLEGQGSMKLDRSKIRKVFVRAPNWLGDVIMATPAFARIRSFLIDAELVCGIKKGHEPILAGFKSFDRYLHVERPRGPRSLIQQVGLLRRERFDLAILFPNSFSSALVSFLAGIPYRLGYVGGRSLLITHGVRALSPRRKDGKRWGPRREPIPMVDYYFTLLDVLDMPKVGADPILVVTPDEEERAAAMLAELGVGPGDRVVLLNPGASFGSSKLWETDRWARLAEGLTAGGGEGLKVVVVCGPGEEELARTIVTQTEAPVCAAVDPVIPLDVLKPVVRRASLMVTTDAGPRHIAAAFRVPHVVLMGPTHPGYTARNLEHAHILRHDVDCGPCHLETCPLDHRCMRLIEVDEVLDACLARLG